MITYRQRTNKNSIVEDVFLDGTKVGTIYPNGRDLWHYQPKGRGNPPGDSLPSVAAVKRTLESMS